MKYIDEYSIIYKLLKSSSLEDIRIAAFLMAEKFTVVEICWMLPGNMMNDPRRDIESNCKVIFDEDIFIKEDLYLAVNRRWISTIKR